MQKEINQSHMASEAGLEPRVYDEDSLLECAGHCQYELAIGTVALLCE